VVLSIEVDCMRSRPNEFVVNSPLPLDRRGLSAAGRTGWLVGGSVGHKDLPGRAVVTRRPTMMATDDTIAYRVGRPRNETLLR